MKRELPTWCKEAKKALIDKNMSVGELAKQCNMTKEYTSAVINGRAYSEPAMKKIGAVLCIKEPENHSLIVN